MQASSKSEAQRLGLKRFFTGRPCKHGHVAERHIASGSCLECTAIWNNSPDHHRQARDWRKRNPDRVKELNERWRDYRVNVSTKAWKKANPDRVKVQDKIKRGRRRRAPGRFTLEDEIRIMTAQHHKCAYCRKNIKPGYHIDHIVPLAKGGTNYPNNIQLLCQRCNNRKSAKDPIKYAQSLGLLL